MVPRIGTMPAVSRLLAIFSILNILLGACGEDDDGVLQVDFVKVVPENSPSPSHPKLVRRQSLIEAVVNAEEFPLIYFMNISVGSPPQQATVQLDTGSADFYVQSLDSSFCQANASSCDQFTSYSVTKSSTAHEIDTESVSLGYGSGYVTATRWNDSIRIGSSIVDDFPVAVANQSYGIAYGIVGLGLHDAVVQNQKNLSISGSLPRTAPSFLESLKYRGAINSLTFSLYLDEKDSGSIIFGGIDTSKFSNYLKVLPLLSFSPATTYYALNVSSVSLTQERNKDPLKLPATNMYAVLDSGTSITYMPADMLRPLRVTLGMSPLEGNYTSNMTISCDYLSSNVNLTFCLGEGSTCIPIDVPIASLIGRGDTGVCTFYVSSLTNLPFILLGDNFLTQVYTVFDLVNNLVGIAPIVRSGLPGSLRSITGLSNQNSATSAG